MRGIELNVIRISFQTCKSHLKWEPCQSLLRVASDCVLALMNAILSSPLAPRRILLALSRIECGLCRISSSRTCKPQFKWAPCQSPTASALSCFWSLSCFDESTSTIVFISHLAPRRILLALSRIETSKLQTLFWVYLVNLPMILIAFLLWSIASCQYIHRCCCHRWTIMADILSPWKIDLRNTMALYSSLMLLLLLLAWIEHPLSYRFFCLQLFGVIDSPFRNTHSSISSDCSDTIIHFHKYLLNIFSMLLKQKATQISKVLAENVHF